MPWDFIESLIDVACDIVEIYEERKNEEPSFSNKRSTIFKDEASASNTSNDAFRINSHDNDY